MGFTGLEPILDKVAAVLTAHLPAKLDALEVGPPVVVLPDVSVVAFGERETFAAYPAIALGPASTSPQSDTGRTRLTQLHEGHVLVYVTDVDEEKLARLQLRYMRAVAEVLAERRDAGDFPFRLYFEERRWTYGPQRGDGMQFFRTARMDLAFEREEDL